MSFRKKTRPELQQLLRDRNLPVTGKKNVLVHRLVDDIIERQHPATNITPIIEMQPPVANSTPNVIEDDHSEDETVINMGREQNRINRREMDFERYAIQRERELFARERELMDRERRLALKEPIVPVQAPVRQTFSIKEVADVFPTFDPVNKVCNSAKQFVQRIQNLQAVYEWPDKILLFASQLRLIGHAKSWNDTLPTD